MHIYTCVHFCHEYYIIFGYIAKRGQQYESCIYNKNYYILF